jgi:hypothetical protein
VLVIRLLLRAKWSINSSSAPLGRLLFFSGILVGG